MHETIAAAADGRLPEWAQAGEERRAHVRRVADLMGEWADRLGREADDRHRWRAAGILHDALRDADPEQLRAMVPEALRDLDGALLHGPAAAERLREEGVMDEALLVAISYHTLGHPDLEEVGRALYLADYLEPGRKKKAKKRAKLRARMPAEMEAVLRKAAIARIRRQVKSGLPLRPETVAFWNGIVDAAA